MTTRLRFCLVLLPMFAGCKYLPHTYYFVAPANEPNPAWIRVVNFTQHAAIYQTNNGVRTGGVVRTGPLPFTHTQDIGMPKAGQDLTWDYYESTIRPGLETTVYMTWEGSRTRTCFVTTQFTPEAGRYYQFLLTSGSSGKCTLSPTLIERDKEGTGWHLVRNENVTYENYGPTAETFYTNSQFENPDYQPPPELYPSTDVR